MSKKKFKVPYNYEEGGFVIIEAEDETVAVAIVNQALEEDSLEGLEGMKPEVTHRDYNAEKAGEVSDV